MYLAVYLCLSMLGYGSAGRCQRVLDRGRGVLFSGWVGGARLSYICLTRRVSGIELGEAVRVTKPSIESFSTESLARQHSIRDTRGCTNELRVSICFATANVSLRA